MGGYLKLTTEFSAKIFLIVVSLNNFTTVISVLMVSTVMRESEGYFYFTISLNCSFASLYFVIVLDF